MIGIGLNQKTVNDYLFQSDDSFQSNTPVYSNELQQAEKKILDIMTNGTSSDIALNDIFKDAYVHGVSITEIDGLDTLYIKIDSEMEDEEYDKLLNNAKQVFGEMQHTIHRDSLLASDHGIITQK